VRGRTPGNKWLKAAIFGSAGYLVATLLAAPSLQSIWKDMNISFGMTVLLAPAVGLASVASIDPDAGLIYGVIGVSNFLLYGFIGLQLGARRESFPTYDDDVQR
jgi:hypothetical protein